MESPGKNPGTFMTTKPNILVILDPRFKPGPQKSEDSALTTVLSLLQLV